MSIQIVDLAFDDVPAATAVLSAAFRHDPLIRWVMGAGVEFYRHLGYELVGAEELGGVTIFGLCQFERVDILPVENDCWRLYAIR
jgi:hypothetical protein